MRHRSYVGSRRDGTLLHCPAWSRGRFACAAGLHPTTAVPTRHSNTANMASVRGALIPAPSHHASQQGRIYNRPVKKGASPIHWPGRYALVGGSNANARLLLAHADLR